MATPKTAQKPARRPVKPRTAKAKATPRKKAQPLVKIGIAPPELVHGSKAFELDQSLRTPATQPAAAQLAATPWLSQDVAFQAGYHVLTQGLRKHARHPELEMCNVPGAFLPEALHLLEVVAGYVLDGTRLDPGEKMLLSERPLAMLAFLKVGPGERGTAHDRDVLRVVFVS